MRPQIRIAECSDEDIPACMAALSSGFGHNTPFFDYYFPKHDTPAGQISGSRRLLAWKQHGDDSTFLKAVAKDDNGTDKVVGLGVWTFMTEPVSDDFDAVELDVPATWLDEDDADHMRALWKAYVRYRNGAIEDSEGRGVYVLEMLAVHRDYQGLGAGFAMTEFGTKAAEKRGVEAVVEATPEGLQCYHKAGFKTAVEKMNLDVPERFADRKKASLLFLRKQPGPSS